MADPACIVAFKKLLKEGPDRSHVDEMVREFYGENDRAAIILLSTFAEQGIVWAIRSKMRKHSLVGQLFDPDGAIGTFGAKISVAFALDLSGTKTKHDLDLIRTLRNGCAHSDIPLRFKTPEVRAVCDHLLLPDTEFAKVPSDWMEMDSIAARDKTNPKTRYATACQTILSHMIAIHLRQPSARPLP